MWERVGPLMPAKLRRLGVALVEKPITRKNVDVSEVIAYLRPMQQAQTDKLVELVGRTFPEWKTLYGG